MKRITEMGGEGVILRDAESEYLHKRSGLMLKVKEFKDAEAEVIAQVSGQGRNAFVMGYLICKTPEGTEIKIGGGFTDKERRNPPKVGSTITYKYFEITKSGKPRFPVYQRPFKHL